MKKACLFLMVISHPLSVYARYYEDAYGDGDGWSVLLGFALVAILMLKDWVEANKSLTKAILVSVVIGFAIAGVRYNRGLFVDFGNIASLLIVASTALVWYWCKEQKSGSEFDGSRMKTAKSPQKSKSENSYPALCNDIRGANRVVEQHGRRKVPINAQSNKKINTEDRL